MRRIFKTLSDPEEVISKLVERECKPKSLDTLKLRLSDAVGYYAAKDIIAPNDVPPFPRSTVDGYAVKSVEVQGASEDRPVVIDVAGYIRVGMDSRKHTQVKGAYEVDTGAMIPPGFDVVVPVEYSRKVGNKVEIYKSYPPFSNIALPGSDICKGEVIVHRGERLNHIKIAALASVGISDVDVYRRIKICIASTGSELLEPGKPLEYGKVYDVNSYMLQARMYELGFDAINMGIIEDDLKAIMDAMLRASKQCDIVIFTGGTSAGPEDLVYRAVREVGEVVAHGLKLKPGKPTVVGVVDNKAFFGLPGNPQSALNVLENIVLPYLQAKYGLEIKRWHPRIRVRLGGALRIERGRRSFIPVKVIERANGELVAYPVADESYKIVSYMLSNGMIVIDENILTPPSMGELIDVELHSHVERKYVVGIPGILEVHTKPGNVYLLKASTSLLSTMLRRRLVDAAVLSNRIEVPGISCTSVCKHKVVAVRRREDASSTCTPPDYVNHAYKLGVNNVIVANTIRECIALYELEFVDSVVLNTSIKWTPSNALLEELGNEELHACSWYQDLLSIVTAMCKHG